MKHAARTWYLIADASRARVFQVERGDDEWTEVESFDWETARLPNREIATDGPGSTKRSQASATQRGKRTQKTEPQETEKEKFARYLIDNLDQAANENAFEALVLVAAPKFLGRLRKRLTPTLEQRLETTLDKDYTQVSEHELPDTMARHIGR